jgi:hypothetical protein
MNRGASGPACPILSQMQLLKNFFLKISYSYKLAIKNPLYHLNLIISELGKIQFFF